MLLGGSHNVEKFIFRGGGGGGSPLSPTELPLSSGVQPIEHFAQHSNSLATATAWQQPQPFWCNLERLCTKMAAISMAKGKCSIPHSLQISWLLTC